MPPAIIFASDVTWSVRTEARALDSIGGVRGGGQAAWEDDVDEATPTQEATEAPRMGAPRRGAAPEKLAALPFGRTASVRSLDEADGVREPSGAAFHKERGTVFIVGDRGHVVEMSREGEVLNKRKLDDLDLEGVTVGPEGRLFAVAEGKPSRIVEIDPDTLKVRRKFKIDNEFEGKKVLARHANDGPEGIVWVPEEKAFYVLNQDRPTRLLKLDVPLDKKDGGKAQVVRSIELDDVVHQKGSDLAWDSKSGHFLVTESGGDSKKGGHIHEVTPKGAHVRSVTIPGRYQEGFALDDKGSAFIAQDSGGILRVDPG